MKKNEVFPNEKNTPITWSHRRAGFSMLLLRSGFLSFICLLCLNSVNGASYYCDPVNGSMSNSGSSTSPWGSLEAVFTANKTFIAGDIIYLRNGYHGFPIVKGINTGYVTIQPQSGHLPTIKKLIVQNAQQWIITGLKISPEVIGSYERGNFVEIRNTSSSITMENCSIYSTAGSIASWTVAELTGRFGFGMRLDGTNCIIRNNIFKEVSFGISMPKTATGNLISGNQVIGFSMDAMRSLADNTTFEYNIIKASYGVDDNHDDAFQCWSLGASGNVGGGVVKNWIVRGNTVIAQEDPNQPFPQTQRGLQGIGFFDGSFENFVIENNVIITDMWHGISLYGAINCKVVNNIVVENPVQNRPLIPWIGIYPHKNGTASVGNVVRNNLVSDFATLQGTVTSNNIVSTDYALHFVDYPHFNVHLKAGSPAINAGTTTDAPTIDLDKNPRSVPYDIGAYEYAGGGGGGDVQAPTVPAGLTSSNITQSSVTLNWTASTDNIGVTGYKVYKNGASPVTVTGTSTSITGLTAGTTYSFTVAAFDAAGNNSAQSTARSVTTLTTDTQAPTVPSALTSSNITQTSAGLSWTASTDNIGVAGYKVYRNGANPVTVTGTSTTITGLTGGTTYSFTVAAFDAAGNNSAQSVAKSVTTSATGTTSSSSWQSFLVANQTTGFTAEFDAVPNGNNIDAVTGILKGVSTGYASNACMVRFNASGQIDARNGAAYAAATSLNYTAGTSYHFRLVMNTNRTYSVYVTPAGQPQVTIATNYAFRTEQASVTSLDSWSIYAFTGSHSVSNVTFSASGARMMAGAESQAPLPVTVAANIFSKILIYPNPVKEGETIRLVTTGAVGEKLQITVNEINGAAVYRQVHTVKGTQPVPLQPRLKKGIYVIYIRGSAGTEYTSKLIVE